MKLKLILEPGTSLFKDSTVFVGGVVDIQESADDLDNKIFINGQFMDSFKNVEFAEPFLRDGKAFLKKFYILSDSKHEIK